MPKATIPVASNAEAQHPPGLSGTSPAAELSDEETARCADQPPGLWSAGRLHVALGNSPSPGVWSMTATTSMPRGSWKHWFPADFGNEEQWCDWDEGEPAMVHVSKLPGTQQVEGPVYVTSQELEDSAVVSEEGLLEMEPFEVFSGQDGLPLSWPYWSGAGYPGGYGPAAAQALQLPCQAWYSSLQDPGRPPDCVCPWPPCTADGLEHPALGEEGCGQAGGQAGKQAQDQGRLPGGVPGTPSTVQTWEASGWHLHQGCSTDVMDGERGSASRMALAPQAELPPDAPGPARRGRMPPLAEGPQAEEPQELASPLPRTTVMLRNLPNNYTRAMLLMLLDAEGFQHQYDFVYLPMDFKTHASLGYAFVNLVSPEQAAAFWETFEGFGKWVVASQKVCSVSWSCPYQGLSAHIERYRNSPVMHEDVPDDYKPMVFQNGVRGAFPVPTKKLKAPRMRLCRDDGAQSTSRELEVQ